MADINNTLESQLNQAKQIISSLKKENKALKSSKALIEEENKYFHRELTLAADLQKNLLPNLDHLSDNISFVSKYLPSTYVGGDFYDVVKISSDKIAVFIMDVSGHGIKSAMIASLVKAIFEKEIQNYSSPKDFFVRLNESFNNIFHSDDFLTAFLVIIDLHAMTATYSSAAHPPILLLKNNGQKYQLKTEGFIVGIFNNSKYYENTIKIDVGDRFVLYTDGIIETEGEDEQFGKERLYSIITSHRESQIEDIADEVLRELIFYSKYPHFEDDITLLLCEIKSKIS